MVSDAPARLVDESKREDGRFYFVTLPHFTIGRGPDNDVVLDYQLTSREHAEINGRDGQLYIRDRNSRNGVKVNGQRIHEERRLQAGDSILIGQTFLRLEFTEVSKPQLLDFLSELTLFANTSPETLRSIIDSSRLKLLKYGQQIAAQDLDDSLYVLLSGEIAVTLSVDEPSRRYKAGHFFDGMLLRQELEAKGISHFDVMRDAYFILVSRSTVNDMIAASTYLSGLAFFRNLTEEQFQALTQNINLAYLEQDRVLFEQGDFSDALYIVIFGQVGMVKRDKDLCDELRAYERGEFFGELGLLVDQPRAARAEVKQPTGVFILRRHKFQELLAEYPDIGLNLYRYLASMLEEQSLKYWRAARDVERMKTLIQAEKMFALGQLVAGIAHEINTPVGSISSNSFQLREILESVKVYYEGLPRLLKLFYEQKNVEAAVNRAGHTPDESTINLVQALGQQQLEMWHEQHQKSDIEYLFDDMNEIAVDLTEAADRITEMVKSLTNFTRLDEAERKTVNIHEGIDSTLSLLRHQLKYQVVVDKQYGDLPKITCYPPQLNQVFMNILMNAIQALDLEKLGKGEKGLIRIRTYREDEWGVVAIEDDGKGIEPNDMESIFEPYFSTKGPAAAAGGLGLGLGLSISKNIVEEKHKGKIEVASQPGEGTTFYIKLPLDRPVTIRDTIMDGTLLTQIHKLVDPKNDLKS